MDVRTLMAMAPVIPVLVVDDPTHAAPIARALVAGGLHVLEVTLRTPAALDVIREMAKVDGAVVGAGTVVTAAQVDDAVAAGARFIVSPGLTERVADAVSSARIPFLPGVATAGDIMRALDLGLTHLKFFPAVAAGGIPALAALSAPFGQVRFCPTGGITAASAPDWLALPQVSCVGGSWIVPRHGCDTRRITEAAIEANGLASRA